MARKEDKVGRRPVDLVALAAGALLASCAGQLVPSGLAPSAGLSADTGNAAARTRSPGLRVGDQVRIVVYGEPDFSAEYRVAEDGTISLPLLGFIQAEGLTVAEFVAGFEAALAERLINDPAVSAEVTASLPVYVLGEVGAPGAYPYQPHMTLQGAVAAAGGFAPRARRGQVMVRGVGDTGERAVPVSPSIEVAPGDTIRVMSRLF